MLTQVILHLGVLHLGILDDGLRCFRIAWILFVGLGSGNLELPRLRALSLILIPAPCNSACRHVPCDLKRPVPAFRAVVPLQHVDSTEEHLQEVPALPEWASDWWLRRYRNSLPPQVYFESFLFRAYIRVVNVCSG